MKNFCTAKRQEDCEESNLTILPTKLLLWKSSPFSFLDSGAVNDNMHL